ncbi:MAG TPA: divergent polysaccharide deacetylase family protein [Stellaceae bacterium]|nr:divergent polysaccharide deacetylase family protein [Stellaceae bacterium]
MRLGGIAIVGNLRRAATGIGDRVVAWKNLTRVQLIWLGGAVALIVIGLVLALSGNAPKPQAVSAAINVPLPPAAGAGEATLLVPAPDPGLIEDTPDGPLPIIGKDGRQAWQVYARPFDAKDPRPRLAFIVTGIGLDQALSQAALDRLPGAVTLAFDPYAGDVKAALANARSLGHETLMGLPLEPLDYPREDPGPLTLLTSLDAGQNGTRLSKLMGEATGYVGVVAIMGSRFDTESQSLMPVLETLKQRGLMVVDDKAPNQSSVAPLAAQLRLPWAAGNTVIDAETDPAAIDQALAGLEATAKRSGSAVGIGALSPALLDRLGPWLGKLDGSGIALAPASALAYRQNTAQPAQ